MNRVRLTSYAPIGTTGFFALALATAILVFPSHLWAALTFAAFVAIFGYWWLYHVDEVLKSRRLTTEQMNTRVRRSNVPEKSIARVRPYLIQGEDEIHWISHRHVSMLVLDIWGLCSLAAVLLAVTAVFGWLHVSLPQVNLPSPTKAKTPPSEVIPAIKPHTPHHHTPQLHLPGHLPIAWWWLTLLGSLVLIVMVLQRWHKWVSWFFIITNQRLLVLEVPFAIFPFAKGEDKPFRLADIKNAEVDGSPFRRRWGLAIMNFSTYLQPEEDEAIKNLQGIPFPDEVEREVNKLVRRGPDSVDESDSDHQALIEAIRELDQTIKEASFPGGQKSD